MYKAKQLSSQNYWCVVFVDRNGYEWKLRQPFSKNIMLFENENAAVATAACANLANKQIEEF